ncbi:MAG: ATP phosphoribosyltransferase regulatory subunit [Clostridia bacterium]|nr:ATP phosphoribosyltransferase regulatory subunit [Clostridia bacterium]
MREKDILKSEEKAVFALRSLYKEYGYLPFKMSKFEEYDLYVRNKDFLVSDAVITFNDTNGTLLALKPDVTLSIIKNTTDNKGCKEKVYYNENVYRVSGSTRRFKEIMQTGLECIGDIDLYDKFEVVYLAAKSLDTVAEDFALDISHMGVFKAILDSTGKDDYFKKEVIRLVTEKNRHETERLCKLYALDEKSEQKLLSVIDLYGDPDMVIEKLFTICESVEEKSALSELCALWELLKKTEYKNRIRVDFSVINDMNYYNGIVFKGFLNGIPEGVLAGGQYDALMERMKRVSGAIGFALYLDLLEGLNKSKRGYDVDVLLLYKDTTDTGKVFERVKTLTEGGFSVTAQKSIPEKLRYKILEEIDGEGK